MFNGIVIFRKEQSSAISCSIQTSQFNYFLNTLRGRVGGASVGRNRSGAGHGCLSGFRGFEPQVG